jgi:hypothetical protein
MIRGKAGRLLKARKIVSKAIKELATENVNCWGKSHCFFACAHMKNSCP